MAEILMPKMGDGMEEGPINVWLKKEGEQVTSGEPIAEVETDKANVEISAYETGKLTKILVQVGQTVPVGTAIAVIGEASAAGATNGTHEAVAAPAIEAALHVASAPAPNLLKAEGGRVKASPLAKRMAKEFGIDLAQLAGTGEGATRIVAKDVAEFKAKQVSAPPAKPVAPAPVLASVGGTPSGAGETFKPSKMREAIARRTLQSKQGIPHFYVTMLIEMDRALKLIKNLNADSADGKITVNDVIVKACAVALKKVPEANSTWTAQGTVYRYAEAHIGIAVAIDEGLIIPVVRNCETKPLRDISNEAKALINKARNGQLKPEEYSGGTFSISNLGMMGVDEFLAIINPPEAAILAIGGISRDPVVLSDSDDIVIRSRMKIALSADHRILDGASAARFLQEVKRALEAPYSLLS